MKLTNMSLSHLRGNCTVDCWAEYKLRALRRGIPVPIGVGALCNSKFKLYRKVGSIVALRESVAAFLLELRRLYRISAVKSLHYGNVILITTVISSSLVTTGLNKCSFQ